MPDSRDTKLASHASDARRLSERIADMERRIAFERSQAVAHSRAFHGSVMRRLTSPTSLLFAGSMGFIAAEILTTRSSKAKGRGRARASGGGSLLKSVLGQVSKPLLTMLQMGSIGVLAKQSHDVQETVSEVQQAPQPPNVLH